MADAPVPFLPYGRHTVEDDDVAAVVNVLRSGWLTGGPAGPAFEDDFAAAVAAPHAVACNSGTAALHLVMMGLGVGPGDVVVVPAITFLASANAARYVGADVVFADVDPDTGLMGPDHLDAALRQAAGRARVAVPVHLAGQACDMPALAEAAARHGVALVEDACHALGTEAQGGRVGDCAQSVAACFSLHPVKTIAGGEGGVITTADPALAGRLRLLRNHGMTRAPEALVKPEAARDTDGRAAPWYYEMQALGYNYRLSDLNAALARAQLAKLNRFAARRRALAQRYDDALGGLHPALEPPRRAPGQDPCWHLYAVRIDFATLGRSRAAVMDDLRAAGVGTQVHYIPVYRQPAYEAWYGTQRLDGAETYYARTLSLPLYPALTEADQDRVIGALHQALAAVS